MKKGNRTANATLWHDSPAGARESGVKIPRETVALWHLVHVHQAFSNAFVNIKKGPGCVVALQSISFIMKDNSQLSEGKTLFRINHPRQVAQKCTQCSPINYTMFANQPLCSCIARAVQVYWESLPAMESGVWANSNAMPESGFCIDQL